MKLFRYMLCSDYIHMRHRLVSDPKILSFYKHFRPEHFLSTFVTFVNEATHA